MFSRMFIATGLLLASLVPLAPARASVTYEVTFEGATLRDYSDTEIGSYSGSFSLTTASYITSIVALAPDSCTLSDNAAALYACDATQSFDPATYLPASLLIGFNTHANDLSSTGTGFLFFDPGSFTADGSYSLDLTPPDGYGSFASSATLTVTSAIPEPATMALLGLPLLGLLVLRRGG